MATKSAVRILLTSRLRGTRRLESSVPENEPVLSANAPMPPALFARAQTIGVSVLGRPIRALERGRAGARRTVLVVGCIHGDECAGTAITRRLARARLPEGAEIWIVHLLNPDGRAARTRQNARGVDLNRNFRSGWRAAGQSWDPEYSGRAPFSEPESRAARTLIRRIRPDVTIWYHQPQATVRAWGWSIAAGRRYARLVGVRFRSIRWPPGSAPNWQNHRFPGSASYVVELPAGSLTAGLASRHARAVLAIARSR
jgi:murein peptide amidase A